MDVSRDIQRLNLALEGRYHVEERVGEGGMATVYLARDLRHDRNVAVKVLKPELAAVVGAERFLAEIRTTARLQHPHILPLHDSGEADGFLYYVMPYVAGESLRERLDRERQLPVPSAVQIASDVAEALDYAHRQGVVHRDVKPANVLMQDGKAVISDFGIALAVDAAGSGRLTETGLSLGTPHYMSPEHATGDGPVGPASDTWAVGCILHEMLVGAPPFGGATPQAVLGRIVAGDARSVTRDRPTVPAHVESAIARALEPVPADRFPTARDFAVALGDPDFRWPRDGEAKRTGSPRWDRASVAVGIALGLVLGFAGLALLTSDDEATTAEIVHTSLVPSSDATLPMSVQPFDISTDGHRVVYRVAVDGEAELRTRLLSESRGVPIPGTRGSGSLFLSPDGAWVAFHHPGDAELRRVRVTGGPVERVAVLRGEERGGDFLGGSWGSDGSIVFATSTGLHRVPATGGPVEALTRLDAAGQVRHRQPRVLPGGSLLHTVTRAGYPGRNELRILTPSGESRVVTEGHSARLLDDGILVYSRGESGELWATRLHSDGPSLGREPVQVMDGVDVNRGYQNVAARYAVSDNGTLLYFPSDVGTTWDVAWAYRDGRIETIVRSSDPGITPGGFGVHAPRLSPEGDRLLFTLVFEDSPNYRIFVYDLRRRTIEPLNVDINADWGVWMADGERIVFNRFDTDTQELYVAPADNSSPPEPLLPRSTAVHYPQAVSPDGGILLAQERASPDAPDRDLARVDLATGEVAPYLRTPTREYMASISPDGAWVAYTSEESGQAAVYVSELPESRTRTRISVGSAFDPIWSPAGDALFYRRASDGGVMAVTFSQGGEGLEIGEPREVGAGGFRTCCTSGHSYDVDAGATRFLVTRISTEASAVPRLEVVQNWLGHVRARLEGLPLP